MHDFSLTHDGALGLTSSESCLPLLGDWLPLNARPGHDPTLATIRVDTAPVSLPRTLPPPVARFGTAECHIEDSTAWVVASGARAVIELDALHADVQLDPAHASPDVIGTLDWAAVLLLARTGRYLIHAAAVLAPDGRALLLAGDGQSGKTTTALNLAAAGWPLLADDHVVLAPAAHGWTVEGWPRVMHVDAGYSAGVPAGARIALTPGSFAEPRHAGPAPLGGMLLPLVDPAAARTECVPAPASAALEMLLRQTAWSIADPMIAPRCFADLAQVARLPARRIRLAADTFASPQLLAGIVGVGLELAAR